MFLSFAMNPYQTKLKPDSSTLLLPSKENKPNPMKETSQIFSLYSQIWAYFLDEFFSAILDIPMIVSFWLLQSIILHIYLLKQTAFAKWLKLDYLTSYMYMRMLYRCFMCSLSLSTFYANFQKIVIKTYYKWASLLIYLLLIYILVFLASLTLVFLISDSSWSN